MRLLTDGNSKLGGTIATFNIPAYHSCPGHTEVCAKLCYARHGFFRYASVKEGQKKRWRAAKGKAFAKRMINEIREGQFKIIRIHAAGDFYSATYIHAWKQIAKACPDVTFFAFTRSWAKKRMLPALIRLSQLPNVTMWFSCDKSMPAPPRVPGVRRAYMSVDDSDQPRRYKVDLVFRDKTKTVQKRMGRFNTLVCPVEQGIDRSTKITCDKCRICFTDYDLNRQQPLVPLTVPKSPLPAIAQQAVVAA